MDRPEPPRAPHPTGAPIPAPDVENPTASAAPEPEAAAGPRLAARAPVTQLPAVLRRPEHLAGRHLDDAHRHQLAGLPAHRLGRSCSAWSASPGRSRPSSWRPFAGVLVDRWNRHRLLVVTQMLSMLQSFALAGLALGARHHRPEIIALTLFQGLINAFDMPARQAFLVEMVDRRETCQRHRAELDDGQRRAADRARPRRDADRGGGRRVVLPDRRRQLPRRDRVAADDARRSAASGRRAGRARPAVDGAKASLRGAVHARSAPSCSCWRW